MNSQFFPVCEGETVSSFPEARQPRSLRRSASGFSFLEYLVAFIILVAAFIPIFLSSQTTIQQVAVTGRHLWRHKLHRVSSTAIFPFPLTSAWPLLPATPQWAARWHI